MGIYVKLRCHKCHNDLTGGYVSNYFAVGVPIIDCRKCGAINKHEDKCTEWSLMPPGRRYHWLFMTISQAVVISGLGGLVLVSIAAAQGVMSSPVVIAATLVGVVGAAVIYRYLRVRAIIRASDVRMSDENYVRKLRNSGIDNQRESPPIDSEEYLDWANREGRWADK